MYSLLGLLVVVSSVTYIIMNNFSSQSESRAAEVAKFEKKSDENLAAWNALGERYATFDTLKSTTISLPVPGKLRGYWLNSNQSGHLLHIDDESVQTEYKMYAGTKCYKKGSSRDLLFYGDIYYISKKRSIEDRYHYTFENRDSLSIELIFNNGQGDVDNYRRVYFYNSDQSQFCS